MLRLTATFKVSLASPLFINRPPRQEGLRTIPPLRYDTRIDDSDVEIALLEIHHAMTIVDRGENILRGPIWVVPRVQVSVSRTETAEPPAIPPMPEGGRNFCDRAPYCHEHILLYRKVALEALCRFLRFFKYRQVHALLRDPIGEDLDNPTWTDDTGQEVLSGVHLVEASLYGIELDDDVGIHALAAIDDPALQQALADPPIEPELYEELLSDARAALFQGHLRRAVLELAISCEVATRHTLSIKAPSGRYKKRGIYLLLDQEAKRVFGECFQDADSEAYMSIDHLFQRRDQIAHQGKGEDIDLAAAKEWFKAADRLFHWLRRMRP
jgi:hypothetical protein